MKHIYDQRAERRQFCPGDKVLVLLPIVGSPFQARFTGPHTVLKQISEENYLISAPERCHVNSSFQTVARTEMEETQFWSGIVVWSTKEH